MLRAARQRQPSVVILLAIVGTLFLTFPLVALLSRVPWPRMIDVLRMPETSQMLQVSVYSAVQSTLIATVLGLACALWLNKLQRGARLVWLLMFLPLALPPVVGGLALTAAIGSRGLAAPLFDALGIQLAFNFPGVVAAHVFVSLPFVVITIDAALRQNDGEIVDLSLIHI